MSNTLFRYFSKSPKATNGTERSNSTDNSKEDSKRKPDSNGHEDSASKRSKNDGKRGWGRSAKNGKSGNHGKEKPAINYLVGDIVWAKLEGHPWWPSIVFNHPGSGNHIRNDEEVHVQFFGSSPSRAWVKKRYVMPYADRKDGQTSFTLPTMADAMKSAEKAQKQSVEERLNLIAPFPASDDEVSQNNSGSVEDDETEEVIEEVSPEIKTGKRKRIALLSSDEGSVEDDETEEVIEKVSPEIKMGKRKRIALLSSDEGSDEDYKPNPAEKSSASGSSGNVSEMEDECLSNRKPKKTKSAQPKPKVFKKDVKRSPSPNADEQLITSPSTSNVSEKTKNRLSAFASTSAETSPVVCTDGDKVWPHLNYEFLKPGKRKDLAGHLESHPDFNPRTLYLPESFKKDLTPALRQWWEMKSQHFEVVLFFKLGKFYELYHMDAVIGFKELNLMSMKGEFAHCGFPEKSYGHYSQMLIQCGYRVARIEQTETPAMMEERCKKSASRTTKYDKVVKREICQITTKGTQRYSILDGVVSDHENKYLLAVKEMSVQGQCGGECEYGVCFVDTSIGKFYLGQFKDDRHGSHFCTLLAHYTPVQVLYEKGGLSAMTQQIMKSYLNNVLIDALNPNTEFWSVKKTLKHLAENKYFCDDSIKDGCVEWPEEIKACLDEYDSLGTTAKTECCLAIQALGACVWYLSDCCLDQELISMKNFVRYDPVDKVTTTRKKSSDKLSEIEARKHMVLDGITLSNLDIVENTSLRNTEGTLYAALNHCRTPFGKRLLRQWLCTPLCNPDAIIDRQDAVSDLLENYYLVVEASDLMKTLPDLERFLSKIHAQGSALRSKNHPDSRAIFFEENLYSKRKICDFLSTLKGFEVAIQVIELFEKSGMTFKSKLLKMCVNKQGSGGNFPVLHKLLQYFEDAFDHNRAKKDGKIIPSPGVDEDYDSAVKEKEELERKLEKYLKEQCQYFGVKVVYFGTGKNRYQLEVAEGAAKRAGDEYELQTSRKGYKRYWTNTTKRYLARMIAIEDNQDAALRDIMRRIFATFAKDLAKWSAALECLSLLDVLMCFAHYAQNVGSPMCRPKIIYPTGDITPFIDIRVGRYPCVSNTSAGDNFIPNDTVVGVTEKNESPDDKASLVIVTGPNMGGKSTLMRQVGVIVIMAQMGCFVPAEKCRLTPADRLFTRLGASDRIMSGESTFFVELSETSSILQHATRHSLVLMDELGRGTATHDGTAIAYGVVKQLAENIRCRTLFSTHYYSLVEDFKENCNVKLGHMACIVDKDDESDGDAASQEAITFLYKFVPGACPKSHGFNAARLAGIPEEVIKMGSEQAKEMEKIASKIKMFRKLCC